MLGQLRTPRIKRLQLSGQLSISANGRGTLQNPEFEASMRLPELQVHGQTIRGLNLDASAANHEAQFTLGSQLVNTSIRAQGKVAAER